MCISTNKPACVYSGRGNFSNLQRFPGQMVFGTYVEVSLHVAVSNWQMLVKIHNVHTGPLSVSLLPNRLDALYTILGPGSEVGWLIYLVSLHCKPTPAINSISSLSPSPLCVSFHYLFSKIHWAESLARTQSVCVSFWEPSRSIISQCVTNNTGPTLSQFSGRNYHIIVPHSVIFPPLVPLIVWLITCELLYCSLAAETATLLCLIMWYISTYCLSLCNL